MVRPDKQDVDLPNRAVGPLVEELAKLKQKVQVGGFVDDVHLLAYSTSTATNCLELKQAYGVCLR